MTIFQNLKQKTKPELRIAAETYLFFGGTAYLGLFDHPDYIALFKEGIDRYGLNTGTSRTNNVQLGIYEEAEVKIANRFGYESAILFSSGYLAAQAAVKSLSEHHTVLYAPSCHPALWLGDEPQVYGDVQQWVTDTVDEINASSASHFLVICNGIDNLWPTTYDFSAFSKISMDKHVVLLLDDSHGIAVVQQNNISSVLGEMRYLPNMEVVIVASLAKGMGTDAGLLLGSRTILDKIRQHPIYRGASPSSPAALYALVNGDQIYEDAYVRLQQNIHYFADNLPADHGLRFTPNFPVFSSKDPALFAFLVEQKILISSFPYPLPDSPLLNRIVISSLHTTTDLDIFLDIYQDKIK